MHVGHDGSSFVSLETRTGCVVPSCHRCGESRRHAATWVGDGSDATCEVESEEREEREGNAGVPGGVRGATNTMEREGT